jgi:hypothetical protein
LPSLARMLTWTSPKHDSTIIITLMNLLRSMSDVQGWGIKRSSISIIDIDLASYQKLLHRSLRRSQIELAIVSTYAL